MKTTGDGRRIARVEREVQNVIANYLIHGFRNPLKGLVTVSQVKMPGDLRMAKVYVSVLGDKKEQEETIKTLQARAFEVQDIINRELKMRFCPKLTFCLDETTLQVLKIDKILSEIKTKNEAEAAAGKTLSIVENESSDEDAE